MLRARVDAGSDATSDAMVRGAACAAVRVGWITAWVPRSSAGESAWWWSARRHCPVRGRAEGEIARILGDLLAAEERLAAALAQRELLETTLVPLVDTQYAAAREVARLGEVNTIILLESLKQQLEAKRQLIAARSDEAHALVDIEHIVGPVRGPGNAAAPTTTTPTLPPTTEEPTP